MSPIERTSVPPPSRQRSFSILRWLVIVGIFAPLFLMNLRFGRPPEVDLDSSWKEVMAWAALKHAHWGRDIVFTYGPLGFLHGGTGYVPGIFVPYMTGQLLVTTAFVAITINMLRNSPLRIFFSFAAVYAISFLWLTSDITWVMILLFGTTAVIDRDAQRSTIASIAELIVLALIFGGIALIKFSLFPLWAFCTLAMAAYSLIQRQPWRALFVLILFPAALLLDWFCCAQDLGDFALYLQASFEIASGYGSAMGTSGSLVEFAGAACLGFFGVLCLLAIYQRRRDVSVWVAIGLYSAAAFLIWRAGLTRSDHAHGFFAYFSMFPFAMLSLGRLAEMQWLRRGLMALIVIGSVPALFAGGTIFMRPMQALNEIAGHYHALTTLPDMQRQRTEEWHAMQKSVELPKIKERVGDATVDTVMVEQGVILLNDMNYAPRPVFQSYSAYTPYLARLNETFFLSAHAPAFIVFKVEAIDGRLPMSEDALSLIVLLQHYRLVLIEQGFLLLQKDPGAAPSLPLSTPTAWTNGKLGEEIALNASPSKLTIAFVKLDLTPLGQIYTALLREPPLRIKVTTDDGKYNYRFIRPTGAAGFTLSPLIRTTQEWASLQLDLPVSHVRGFRIEPEVAWHELFFQRRFEVGYIAQDYAHRTSMNETKELPGEVYPGFNIMPSEVRANGELIIEDGSSALEFTGPGELHFKPAPARYRVSGEFGVEGGAMNPACSAAAGVGMSLVRLNNGAESRLLYLELDPLHVSTDRGAHRFELAAVDIAEGDDIAYRIDMRHAGDNIWCARSYVRNLRFELIDAGGAN